MPADESYPDELLYHREHDWARIDGDVATFGITWYAQDSLGDIVVYLPPEKAEPGTPIEIDVRGKLRAAEVATKPLYSKER